MGAQNFNFAPEFPSNGGFSAPNFALLEVNFLTKKIFRQAELYRANCAFPAPAMTPLLPVAIRPLKTPSLQFLLDAKNIVQLVLCFQSFTETKLGVQFMSFNWCRFLMG